MKKVKLAIDISTFYNVVGIYSGSKLYQIIWKINKELSYQLYNEKEKSISLQRKKNESVHQVYHFCKTDLETCLSIIENNGTMGMLLTKSPKPILIAVFCGTNAKSWSEKFIKEIRDVNNIDAFELPLNTMTAYLHEFINHD